MIKYPPSLKHGDCIGIVCPAGFMSADRVAACVQTLEKWGYRVKLGKTVGGNSETYFSGTDEERLDDLQEMMDDPRIDAVLCGRGGYGTGRIVDHINFKRFKKHPKWIVGYSDITILHSHLYRNYYIASIHGPMAGAFNEDSGENIYLQSLKDALEGGFGRYTCDAHELNRRGEAVGELVGGNLSLLAHAVGTDSDLKTKGRILFIEEVGELLYSIDRMMIQLKRSKKLSKIAGLIIGGITETRDTERPFGEDAYQIIYDHVKEYKYPVCFGFPVSHERENFALKIGVGYKLRVAKNRVYLEE